MNKDELMAEMRRNGKTLATMAEELKISENALWRKINGYNQFTLKEIRGIEHKLNLSEDTTRAIFFSD